MGMVTTVLMLAATVVQPVFTNFNDIAGNTQVMVGLKEWSEAVVTTNTVTTYVADAAVTNAGAVAEAKAYVNAYTNQAPDYVNVSNKAVNAVQYVTDKDGNKTAITIGERNSGYDVGCNSFAQGSSIVASGMFSFSRGSSSQAIGSSSYACGDNSIAEGVASVAEGGASWAYGNYSHAEGVGSVSKGQYSHAEGCYSRTGTSTTGHNYAFAWNGDDYYEEPNYYESHGVGTFNINPVGGLSGFYIGETNFVGHVTNIVNKTERLWSSDKTYYHDVDGNIIRPEHVISGNTWDTTGGVELYYAGDSVIGDSHVLTWTNSTTYKMQYFSTNGWAVFATSWFSMTCTNGIPAGITDYKDMPGGTYSFFNPAESASYDNVYNAYSDRTVNHVINKFVTTNSLASLVADKTDVGELGPENIYSFGSGVSTFYSPGDIVTRNGKYYRCKQITDRAVWYANSWVEITPNLADITYSTARLTTPITKWKLGRFYEAGDVVFHTNDIHICKNSHTGSEETAPGPGSEGGKYCWDDYSAQFVKSSGNLTLAGNATIVGNLSRSLALKWYEDGEDVIGLYGGNSSLYIDPYLKIKGQWHPNSVEFGVALPVSTSIAPTGYAAGIVYGYYDSSATTTYQLYFPRKSGVIAVYDDIAQYVGSVVTNTCPAFSNAVLAVGLGIDTNLVAAINAMNEGGSPIDPVTGTTTVGGLLAALAAAIAWLKKNKATKKVPSATYNIATLDANGDLADSGISIEVVDAVPETPAANTLYFVTGS